MSYSLCQHYTGILWFHFTPLKSKWDRKACWVSPLSLEIVTIFTKKFAKFEVFLKRMIYLLICVLTGRTNPSCPYRDCVISNTHKKMFENKMLCLPVLEDSVKIQVSNMKKNEAMLSLTRKLPNTMRKHLCKKWVRK